MFGYIPDQRIAILCGIYFLLSLIMAEIIRRLPVFSWTWTSVFGIISVNIGLVFFVWLPRGELLHPITVLIEEYLVFASSLPPLSIGEYRQYRQGKKNSRDKVWQILAEHEAKLVSIFACLADKCPVEDICHN